MARHCASQNNFRRLALRSLEDADASEAVALLQRARRAEAQYFRFQRSSRRNAPRSLADTG